MAAQPVVLPQPQEARYGSGRLALRGIEIAIAEPVADEDRFAGRQLAACLATRAGSEVNLRERTAGPGAILLKRTGGIDALAMPGERAGRDSRESYDLTISGSGAELRARSTAGLFYGVQTICQLAGGTGAGAALPEAEIHDWPSLPYRGTMVDMSHGAMPSEAEVKHHLDLLARFKANQYYFYSEAAIELDGYPLVNPEGRFTKDEVRRIVTYGRERHIDVIPLVEFYGHIHDLLRVEHYSNLGTFPHGQELDPKNPEAAALLDDWAGQISELFPSAFAHVGMDETWQIEKAAKKEGGSPGMMYAEQLRRVTQLFQKRGKTVMAWADIMVKYPEILDHLPDGLIPVPWDYDATPDTKRYFDPLLAKKLPQIIQTGVANWSELTPDFDMTFDNVDQFLAAGRRGGTQGLINSIWTDSGQNLLRLAWPALAYGAIAPWQSTPVDRTNFYAAYARLLYPPDAVDDAGAAFRDLAKAQIILKRVLGSHNQHEMWHDPFTARSLKRTAEHRKELRNVRLAAEDAQVHAARAMKAGAGEDTFKSALAGSRLLDYAAFRFLNAFEIDERWRELQPGFTREAFWNEFDSEVIYTSHGRTQDMMDAIANLRPLYREAWLIEYTPYRLGTALGRFDAEYQLWRTVQDRLRVFTRDLPEKGRLPSLQSVIGTVEVPAVVKVE
jgi:hexosaminidase